MAERRFYQGETFANYDPGELLENAEFEDCVFDHCRWLGTRVQNCRFNACTFDHCNFSGVVFSFTTMKDAWLLNSAFRSMAWGGLQGKSGVFQPFGKIKNCAFRYNDFSGPVAEDSSPSPRLSIPRSSVVHRWHDGYNCCSLLHSSGRPDQNR